MLDTDEPALWYALNRLMTNYWANVDEDGGCQTQDFYLPNALFAVGDNRFEGEEKICAFYKLRRERIKTSRHLVTNLRVFRQDAQHASAVGMVILYVTPSASTFHGAKPPSMIADFKADCVLGDDSAWRFQSHVLQPILIGNDLPISIAIDPRRL